MRQQIQNQEIEEMPEAPEFPEYATTYSKEARPLRDALSASLRKTLDDIEDRLAENPDGHPNKTKPFFKSIASTSAITVLLF